jgi:tagatose-1,6-bisphosphate aldolase non-catalytic subunit AgaZ/GatZ
MLMTDTQKTRFAADLTKMAGEAPKEIFDYSDGWSAFFATEIAALRVANRYSTADRVKFCPNVGWWSASVRN